jgi:hypothetical protein
VRHRRFASCFGSAMLIACGAPNGDPQVRGESSSSRPPADSLVLTSAGGMEVWFTLARAEVGPGGEPCLERGLEIRHRGSRVQVPLLYTGTPPVLVNDSTIRAVLWTHCQPGESYLVNLRTGQPLPERRRDRS